MLRQLYLQVSKAPSQAGRQVTLEGWSKLHCRHDQTCRWRAQDGLTGIYPFAEAEPDSNRGYAAGEGGVGSVVVDRQVPLGRGRRLQHQPEV